MERLDVCERTLQKPLDIETKDLELLNESEKLKVTHNILVREKLLLISSK